MTRWNDLSPRQCEAAQAAFIASAIADTVWEAIGPDDADDEDNAPTDAEKERRRPPPPVGASDIYACATGTADSGTAARVDAAVAQSPASANMLWQMLDRITAYAAPRVAAAADGGISERQGDGFVLRLRESRTKPDQLYVLIVLEQAESPPGQLFVRAPDGAVVRQSLPAPTDDTIQLLARRSDALVGALNDPGSEVRLR